MIRRPNRKYNLSPSRRTVGRGAALNEGPQASPVAITSVTHSSSTLLVVFATLFVWSGSIPEWTNNGAHCIGVTVTSGTTATLTMSGATAAGATVVPFQDPSFRNNTGGYVPAGIITAA